MQRILVESFKRFMFITREHKTSSRCNIAEISEYFKSSAKLPFSTIMHYLRLQYPLQLCYRCIHCENYGSQRADLYTLWEPRITKYRKRDSLLICASMDNRVSWSWKRWNTLWQMETTGHKISEMFVIVHLCKYGQSCSVITTAMIANKLACISRG
jgi:hypothetical protein